MCLHLLFFVGLLSFVGYWLVGCWLVVVTAAVIVVVVVLCVLLTTTSWGKKLYMLPLTISNNNDTRKTGRGERGEGDAANIYM